MNTFSGATDTHLQLAGHTLVGFDQAILVVHHDATLVFTFGVIAKSDGNAFALRSIEGNLK